MFNRRLRNNIKNLDVQIGILSEELEGLEKDSKYEAVMDKLKSITELRTSLARDLKENETSSAVSAMDAQIEELTMVLQHLGRDDEYVEKLNKLEELTKIRCQLSESKVKNSVKPVVVSGLFGMASMLIVLKYEKDDVIITSKAFNMVSSMFRGSK